MNIKLAENNNNSNQLQNGNSDLKLVGTGEHCFKVTKVQADNQTGVVKIHCVTPKNEWLFLKYNLIGRDGQPNAKSYSVFSYVARSILGDLSVDTIDTDALVGREFMASVNVVSKPSYNDPNRMLEFRNISHIQPIQSGPMGRVDQQSYTINDEDIPF